MPDTFLAIQTLGFATGTVLYSLLALLIRRANRLSQHQDFSSASALLGLLWNVGMLAEFVAGLAGFSESGRLMKLLSALAYSALALLPTVFLIEAVRRYERRRPLRGKRWLLAASCAAATVLTACLFSRAFGVSLFKFFPRLLELIAYNLMIHLAVVFRLFSRTKELPTRRFIRAELWLLVGLAATLLLLIHTSLDSAIDLTILVISQQSGIPIALVAIASLYRFRFADVFIKRSFTILAAVITVLVYSLFVIRPLLRMVRASARYPEAAAWVVMTLLGCLLLLAFPAIRRLIYTATDRWLFHRPDYRQLIEEFARIIETAETEEQLFAEVEQRLESALQVERISISQTGAADSELQLPIKVNANIACQLTVKPGAEGRKLLSDELAFLASLAEKIGRRLESLQFERERRRRELRESHLRQSLTEAELRALQAQINPHFLFNTLNTIADLIGSEPEKAESMTERLAEVFRYVLAQTETRTISVSEEFDFLKTYLTIEQVRFGDRLKVEMTIAPAAAQLQMPPLLLQPIVENAVKHGLSPKREGGRINISAETQNGFLRLMIADDGVGWNELSPSVKNNGVGLKNVKERLLTIYEGRAELQIRSSAESGTQISITIPNDETQNLAH